MKGDFTRDTFDKTKRFSRVFAQQGRVQLDADSNEQAAILLHYLRTLAADIIGPYAGPSSCLGFRVMREQDLSADDKAVLAASGVQLKPGDFAIGSGRYYVDGILCENFLVTTYLTQEDFTSPPPLVQGRTYLAYLRVWERHITSVEDDSIREKALGGPDTATRAKVVWQLRLTDKLPNQNDIPGNFNCANVKPLWRDWTGGWQPAYRGVMTARIEESEASKDPCVIAPDSKYRGAENQLYRVEVRRGGTAWPAGAKLDDGTHATFVWSRDNGSVTTNLVELDGDALVVQSARGFSPGDWVEVTDDARELRGESGTLARLVNVEADSLTFDPASRSDDVDLGTLKKVRLWNQRQTGDVELSGGAVPLVEGEWIPLEDGIEVYFGPPPNAPAGVPPANYRAGDYWLIPARVVTGDIEWPQRKTTAGDGGVQYEPRAMPPRGVVYHFAPIAVVSFNGQTLDLRGDCRCDFDPINDCGAYAYGCGDLGIGLENL